MVHSTTSLQALAVLTVCLGTVQSAPVASTAPTNEEQCLAVTTAVQGDFKALLAEPSTDGKHTIATRLAQRFAPDGTMADPVWNPNTGRDAIAKAEAATYAAVPGCTVEFTWTLPRIAVGNSSFPPPGTTPVNVYCAVDINYNITLVSTKTTSLSCTALGVETDTAEIDTSSGLLKNFATIYDYAGFAAKYGACVAKICGK
eukprot:m.181586 g.181586  ORF g.181586 m.181586 type:complete len:201 (-) comp15311_c0_seq1:175-777(-)